MKKELIFGFFVLILLSANVMAAEGDDPGAGLTGDNSGDATDADGTTEQLGDLTSGVDTSQAKSKTNEILAKEIQIPEKYQKIARLVFGLKEGAPIDLQTFIILVVVWLGCLITMKFFADILPSSNLKKWAGAVIVTLLMAISGGLLLATQFFLDLSQLFGLIKEWGVFSTAMAIIMAAIIVYVSSFVVRYLKLRSGEARAYRKGEDIAFLSTAARIARETS